MSKHGLFLFINATLSFEAWVALALIFNVPSHWPVPFLQTPPQDPHLLIGSQKNDYTSILLKEINFYRKRHGHPPLRIDSRLISAAQHHAVTLSRYQNLTHISPDGSSPADRVRKAGYPCLAIVENIAVGQRQPKEVLRDWIKSPPHRANLLNPTLKDLGVGFMNGYWVLILSSHQ